MKVGREEFEAVVKKVKTAETKPDEAVASVVDTIQSVKLWTERGLARLRQEKKK